MDKKQNFWKGVWKLNPLKISRCNGKLQVEKGQDYVASLLALFSQLSAEKIAEEAYVMLLNMGNILDPNLEDYHHIAFVEEDIELLAFVFTAGKALQCGELVRTADIMKKSALRFWEIHSPDEAICQDLQESSQLELCYTAAYQLAQNLLSERFPF